MNKMKEFLYSVFDTVKQVNDESNAFRAQEKPCTKTVSAKQPEATPCASNTCANATLQTKYECSALSRCIARALIDFPSHINIQAPSHAVAIPVAKLENGTFAIKLYKNDPSKEFSSSSFSVELQPELNTRVERVQLEAIQDFSQADDTLSQIIQRLTVEYNNPYSPYFGDVSHYNCNVNLAIQDHNQFEKHNRCYLNSIRFSSLLDCGHYVVVYFTAGYNGGSVIC